VRGVVDFAPRDRGAPPRGAQHAPWLVVRSRSDLAPRAGEGSEQGRERNSVRGSEGAAFFVTASG